LIRLSAMPRGYRDNDVARDLKVPSWKVRLLRGQLRGWSVAGLEHALRAVGDGDLAIKGGSTDHVLALSELVLAVSDCRDAQ
jgi:DNA polymerase-3 subunit delta